MNFWKTPDSNVFKVGIAIVVVVLAGSFVYTYMHKNSLEGKGSVAVIPGAPLVTTGTTQNFGTRAVFRGTITDAGTSPVTVRGFVVDTHTIYRNGASLPIGNYASSQIAIVENKDLPYLDDIACGGYTGTYQAFAGNSAGIGYGDVKTFKTAPCLKNGKSVAVEDEDLLDLLDDMTSHPGKVPVSDPANPNSVVGTSKVSKDDDDDDEDGGGSSTGTGKGGDTGGGTTDGEGGNTLPGPGVTSSGTTYGSGTGDSGGGAGTGINSGPHLNVPVHPQ